MIKQIAGFNLSQLQLLGSGTQGKVYKIDSQRCIKVFTKKKHCKDELETLIAAQIDSHFPRLYWYGDYFIIREFIDGIQLDSYLSSYPMTSEICSGILELYYAMSRVGFTRLDTALFHIFITPYGQFKLIDTAKALKKKATYPALIIEGLRELDLDKQFLNFVSLTNPELYRRWLMRSESNMRK